MATETRYITTWGFWPLFFWGFIVVKIAGHLFADWSWWWVLLPVIPWIGAAVAHFGL